MKAFDTVNHRYLILKLDCYGVRGLPLDLLGSYFTGRNQNVNLGDFTLKWISVTHGVPQGSVPNHFLFLTYISYLSSYC